MIAVYLQSPMVCYYSHFFQDENLNLTVVAQYQLLLDVKGPCCFALELRLFCNETRAYILHFNQ